MTLEEALKRIESLDAEIKRLRQRSDELQTENLRLKTAVDILKVLIKSLAEKK